MTDLAGTAPFENIDEAVDIAGDIFTRMIDGISHSGLGGKMDYKIETFAREQFGHSTDILETHANEGKITGLQRSKLREIVRIRYGNDTESMKTGQLEGRVIICI